MHPPPLLLAEKKRSAVHGVGEEEALVQTKMDPCFYKMSLCKVASACKFGANLDAPCFSFRCRSPGVHIARYFFTIHSYFREAGGGAGWPHSGQTEGASTGFR